MILKICSDLDDSMTSWFWDILNRSLDNTGLKLSNNTGLKLSHHIVPFSFVYCAHWKGITFSAGGHTVPKNIANTGNINLSRMVVMLLCVPSLGCNLLEGTDKALLELKLDTLPHLMTFGFRITRPHELFPVCEQCFLLDFFTLMCSGSKSERVKSSDSPELNVQWGSQKGACWLYYLGRIPELKVRGEHWCCAPLHE